MILGEEVRRFEKSWAEYCGKTFCVSVGNGYDAMRIMLLSAGVEKNDTVIVPSNTHISGWLAVLSVGASILPVEPDPVTMCVTADGIKATHGYRRASVYLLTHLYGNSAYTTELEQLAEDNDALLLFDACQGHGLRFQDLGHASAFSFYPTKNLGALGDGGAIVTDDEILYHTALALRNYGGTVKNQHEFSDGCNSRMDELQAAFLTAKLSYLDEWNAKRSSIAMTYSHSLQDVAAVTLPSHAKDVWHQYVIRVANRDRFRNQLLEHGIETLIHYPRCPADQNAFCDSGIETPYARELSQTVISLPLDPFLTLAQVNRVVEVVREYAK